MTAVELKKKIRANWKKENAGFAPPADWQTALISRIVSSNAFHTAQKVALFYGRLHEPKVQDLWAHRPQACFFPRVEGDGLVFYQPASEQDFEIGAFGILEPRPSCPTASNWGKDDLVLVPGLVFDRHGGRLGNGKGFYDRFLQNKQVKTCGVVFSKHILNEGLPQQNFDLTVDAVVSEKEWIQVRRW